MIYLRICQLKFIRVLPHGGLSHLGSPYYQRRSEEKRTEYWMQRLEYSSDVKKAASKIDLQVLKKINWKGLVSSVGCAYREIPWGEVSKAPTPIFWTSLVAAMAFWIPPITSIVIGYANWLSAAELSWAALSCSFMGGLSYNKTESPTWHQVTVSSLPPMVSFVALLLPQLLAYPVLIATLAIASFHRVLNSDLPLWYRSLRLIICSVSLLALILMFLIRILHFTSK